MNDPQSVVRYLQALRVYRFAHRNIDAIPGWANWPSMTMGYKPAGPFSTSQGCAPSRNTSTYADTLQTEAAAQPARMSDG